MMIVYKVTGFWFNKLFNPQTSTLKLFNPQTLQTLYSSNLKLLSAWLD